MEIIELGERFQIQDDLVSTADLRICVAKDSVTNRTVIMREIVQADNDPGFPERLIKDVERQIALNSSLIPKIIGVFRDESCYYVVRNFPGGVSLVTYREKNPQLVRNQAEGWINAFITEIDNLHRCQPPYVAGRFAAEDFLVSPSGELLFMPISNDALQPPDLMGDTIPDGDQAPTSTTPLFFDVHCTMRLAWWLLTGDSIQIGCPQPPLKMADFPETSSVWLRGIQSAVDPLFPQPPQSMAQLRALLLGTSISSAAVNLAPPKLEYKVSDIRFLNGPSGRVAQGILSITNAGGGELRGYSRSTQRWARVVPNTFEGNKTELQFWIDPTGMRASEEHHAHIYLVSQNQEIDVPVEVKTAPHWLSNLPDLFAGLALVLPGLLLTLCAIFLLMSGENKAMAGLEVINEAPIVLEGTLRDRLPEALATHVFTPGDPVLTNAMVVSSLALACFAGCPVSVFLIFRYFGEEQRRRLQWLELAAMGLPLLMLIILWNRPTLNHTCFQHKDFLVMSIKANIHKYLLLVLGWTALLNNYSQKWLDSHLKDADKTKTLVYFAFTAVTLFMLISTMFG